MLIATDLDGTLVPNDSAEPSPYTAEVLGRVNSAGIPVVFVTGRPLRWMEGFWPHVGEHGLAVVSNGAVVYDVHAREPISVMGIEPEAGLEIVAAIAGAVPGAAFAIEDLCGIRQDPDFAELHPVPKASPRGRLSEIWEQAAVKLLVRHPAMGHDELRKRVIAAVGNRATATWSVPGLVEISATGISKASALIGLCRRLGVRPAEVVAFGDMPNDISMLRWAGTSYAMADAHQSVLAVADRVAPPSKEDGVARILDSMLVHGPGSPAVLG